MQGTREHSKIAMKTRWFPPNIFKILPIEKPVAAETTATGPTEAKESLILPTSLTSTKCPMRGDGRQLVSIWCKLPSLMLLLVVIVLWWSPKMIYETRSAISRKLLNADRAPSSQWKSPKSIRI